MAVNRFEKVDRFLDRTLTDIAQQRAQRNRPQTGADLNEGAVVSIADDVSNSVDGKARIMFDEEVTRPRASLLSIPYELRAGILEYVIGQPGQTFISSRQQVTASFIEDRRTSPTVSREMMQLLPGMTMEKKCPTRFSHPSSAFRSYAESRHADTSILYVCHQLRNEALPLWYKYKYYLTLVIEQGHYPPPVRLLVDLNRQRSNDNCSTGGGGGGGGGGAGGRKDTRTLQFDECDQEFFWYHVKSDLRFPKLSVMNLFRKFHISLFVEESAFAGIDAWRGVRNGLASKDIIKILMGDTAWSLDDCKSKSDGTAGSSRLAASKPIATVWPPPSNEGNHAVVDGAAQEGEEQRRHAHDDDHKPHGCTCDNHKVAGQQSESDRNSEADPHLANRILILDHTYLSLASDALYDTSLMIREKDDHNGNGETRLSMSVEKWRT